VPANFLDYDQQSLAGRMKTRALQLIREGFETLKHVRDIEIQMRGGDGTQDVHYALNASEQGFQAGGYATAQAAARASFEELDSLYSKLSTDAQVAAVNAAMFQACAKHGV
jgi:hypothetical protein